MKKINSAASENLGKLNVKKAIENKNCNNIKRALTKSFCQIWRAS